MGMEYSLASLGMSIEEKFKSINAYFFSNVL
jgi:hypothetical protein